VNQLQSSLRSRIEAYRNIREVFRVITDFDVLQAEDIRKFLVDLAKTYCADLESSVFPDEMVQFVDFAKSKKSPASIAMLLHTEDLQFTFPNVSIALRMYMCLMVSNCTGERSFSKLALIKNKLRSTMKDKRLTALELLSVESELLDTVSFKDILDQFAAAKSRKCEL
jgi:hypothetical protein